MTRANKDSNGSSSATVGFEQKLWAAADALRNNMDAAEYKHVVLGLHARRSLPPWRLSDRRAPRRRPIVRHRRRRRGRTTRRAASPIAVDAMADDANLGQGFDVQVHEFPGTRAFVTHRWRLGRIEQRQPRQTDTDKHCGHGGPRRWTLD
jgi:hypothetical protein